MPQGDVQFASILRDVWNKDDEEKNQEEMSWRKERAGSEK